MRDVSRETWTVIQRPGLRRYTRGREPDAPPSGQDFLGSDGAQHWTPAVLVGARYTPIGVGKMSGLTGIWPSDLGHRYSRSDVTSVLSRSRAEELRHWLTTLTHDLAEPQRRDPHSHSRALLSARIAGWSRRSKARAPQRVGRRRSLSRTEAGVGRDRLSTMQGSIHGSRGTASSHLPSALSRHRCCSPCA